MKLPLRYSFTIFSLFKLQERLSYEIEEIYAYEYMFLFFLLQKGLDEGRDEKVGHITSFPNLTMCLQHQACQIYHLVFLGWVVHCCHHVVLVYLWRTPT